MRAVEASADRIQLDIVAVHYMVAGTTYFQP
jgi:hypothetical protein